MLRSARIWTQHSPSPSALDARIQADVFIQIMRQLRVENPAVLGHSWGALLGAAVGTRFDYPIRGLVLVSGYYFPTFRLDAWLLSGPAVPVIGDLIAYTAAPLSALLLLPGILHKVFGPLPTPSNFKKEFPFSLALRPKQLRAAAEETAYLIPAAARLQFQYRRIKCPVRLFHGDCDQLIEKEQSDRLHVILRRSVMQTVPRAGHMAHYTDSELISRAVDDLQRSVDMC